ncbi:MAG: hypothetical protein J6K19_06090 [Prevotella sp.]|nr:hypothetical protein [Prevotella sp.]
MRHIIIYIMSAFMLLSVASCGQQHKAESTVKDFMADNMTGDGNPTGMEFSRLDSTKYITDSLIQKMHRDAELSGRYKSGIRYASGKGLKKLMISRVEYMLGKEKHSDTYYLDEELTHVVSVKAN